MGTRPIGRSSMADDEAAAMELKKKRTFRKFTYRGIDLDNLVDLKQDQLVDLVHARARRRLMRGITKKGKVLKKKVRGAALLPRDGRSKLPACGSAADLGRGLAVTG